MNKEREYPKWLRALDIAGLILVVVGAVLSGPAAWASVFVPLGIGLGIGLFMVTAYKTMPFLRQYRFGEWLDTVFFPFLLKISRWLGNIVNILFFCAIGMWLLGALAGLLVLALIALGPVGIMTIAVYAIVRLWKRGKNEH